VLACAEKSGTVPQTVVAVRTGVSRESVRKWRVRFMERRLDGLADVPRPLGLVGTLAEPGSESSRLVEARSAPATRFRCVAAD
jgi:hypothetical protein